MKAHIRPALHFNIRVNELNVVWYSSFVGRFNISYVNQNFQIINNFLSVLLLIMMPSENSFNFRYTKNYIHAQNTKTVQVLLPITFLWMSIKIRMWDRSTLSQMGVNFGLKNALQYPECYNKHNLFVFACEIWSFLRSEWTPTWISFWVSDAFISKCYFKVPGSELSTFYPRGLAACSPSFPKRLLPTPLTLNSCWTNHYLLSPLPLTPDCPSLHFIRDWERVRPSSCSI